MMEELLFLVEPLGWSREISMVSLIVASTFAMVYIVFRFLKTMKPLIRAEEEDFIFTSEQDELFAEKTLERLKYFLTRIYHPVHTTAHTVEEIKLYVQNHEILDLLESLEKAEYSKKTLSLEEKQSLNTRLSGIIPTLTSMNRH